MTLADGIRAIYAQIDAPGWAAPNLDALVDLLRDLSWLPERAVDVVAPDVDEPDGRRLRDALYLAAAETAESVRPVRVAP